ncbi:MAG TPA: fumarylacetoacetate hydrolase family protein [Methylomirabilota bacterium]|nr:fumarylacetoacetate hydrolase family protein [Methylomirabilota bacterium]
MITFDKAGTPTLGVERAGELVDLSVAVPDLPKDLKSLIVAGEAAFERAKAAVAQSKKEAVVPLAGLRYRPPIALTGKIICLGLNYVSHAAESPFDKPTYPVLFARFPNSIVGHNEPLIRPSVSIQFDYEGELVCVIGRRGYRVPRERALSIVAGYSIFNDGSIRDYQFKTPQWTIGKNFDKTGSFGPALVTADELPPGASELKLQTRLNGATMQSASTEDMIFGVAETIAIITECMTLEPGDLLVMGTPGGVGFARKPPIWMKPGDVCEIEIDGIGILRNPIGEA